MSTLLLYLSSLTISGAVYPTVPQGVMVCSSHTIFDSPKSAIFTLPISPPPIPGWNSPSSSFSSSYGRCTGLREGIIGMRSNKRFSGLISLKNKSQQWVKPITNYGDLPVDNTSLLVQISNTFSDLQDNVTGKSLRKVGELDDLME